MVIGVAACHESKPAETFTAPPAAVVESFQHFADSVTPRLYKVLDSAGIHAGWSDTSGAGRKPQVHVSQQNAAEARAEIYEADLTLSLHEHLGEQSGVPMTKSLFLEFATVGAAERWALITSSGYPFTMVTSSKRNDLPLDLELHVLLNGASAQIDAYQGYKDDMYDWFGEGSY